MLDVQRKSGRPVSTVNTTRGQSHPVEVRSTLSPGGRREAESRIYSAVGPTSGDVDETSLTYSYGPDGALSRIDSAAVIGPGEISVTIDPTTGWTYSTSTPATRAVYQYDSAGRIADRRTTVGTGPGAVTITSPTTYDVAGNVTAQATWTYDYDKLGRLTRAEDSATGEVLEYRYDLASNRREVRRNGDVTQVLSFGAANEIDTGTHPEFAYDTYGRLISDTTSTGDRRHYIWDTASRLTGIDLYEVETGHFRNLRMSYDASGRLVERATYLDLTYLIERLSFHYDGDRLIAELDDTGVVREYLYAGGEAPSAMRARQGDGSYANYFFVTNTHGDVVAVTDRDGMIVNRYQYGPWGEATKLAEGVHQPFRYAGYRYEDGFDLYYLRARWYDAGTGRFLSRDEWRGLAFRIQTLNRYLYSLSSPASLVDPNGESPREPRSRTSHHEPGETATRTCPSSGREAPRRGWPEQFNKKLTEEDRASFHNTYTSVCILFVQLFVDLPSLLPVKEDKYWIPALWSLMRQIYVELANDPNDCANLGMHEIPIGFWTAWDAGVIKQSPSFQPVVLGISRIIGGQWGDIIGKLERGSPGRL